MEPATIEPRGGHNGVLKASGWQGKRENIDATLSQHGCAQASGTFLGGPGAPFKIDSRERMWAALAALLAALGLVLGRS